jgi:hypothetical protein
MSKIFLSIVLLPNAKCVFLNLVPRKRTLSFFNGNVFPFHDKFPSNRPRLLFGASYSISAKEKKNSSYQEE